MGCSAQWQHMLAHNEHSTHHTCIPSSGASRTVHEDFLLPMKDVASLTAELQEVSVSWISMFLKVPLDRHCWSACQPLLPDLHCAQKLGAFHTRACVGRRGKGSENGARWGNIQHKLWQKTMMAVSEFCPSFARWRAVVLCWGRLLYVMYKAVSCNNQTQCTQENLLNNRQAGFIPNSLYTTCNPSIHIAVRKSNSLPLNQRINNTFLSYKGNMRLGTWAAVTSFFPRVCMVCLGQFQDEASVAVLHQHLSRQSR